MKCIICHYSEIALKGKNRIFFEKKLVFNIKKLLTEAKIDRLYGKIIIYSKEEGVESKLKKIPGIEYFSFAKKVDSEVEKIKKEVLKSILNEKFDTFRITVRRAYKSFPLSSMEMAAMIGREVVVNMNKKVDLRNPELNCFVEIDKDKTYIYFKKIKGIGGLPTNTGGLMISLLSGGIDSPVASFNIIKRGAKCIFLHFHAYPTTSKQSIEKVKRIVKTLSSYQGESFLYLVSFDKIQKEIMINTEEKMRVLIYRRFMFRIAESMLKQKNAKAIVTGESLGQVASQTVENMRATEGAIDALVLRPLIGFNKSEIINKAEEIGTYDVSILPEDDCCVRFLPQKPETKGDVLKIEAEEEKLDTLGLVNKALEEVEEIIINPFNEK